MDDIQTVEAAETAGGATSISLKNKYLYKFQSFPLQIAMTTRNPFSSSDLLLNLEFINLNRYVNI